MQSLSTQAIKTPDELKGQTSVIRLGQSGHIPKYIVSLPYKSDIQSLTDEDFLSMTADQRLNLETSLETKMEQYNLIMESDGWIKLNETDADLKKVYPLPLDYLP